MCPNPDCRYVVTREMLYGDKCDLCETASKDDVGFLPRSCLPKKERENEHCFGGCGKPIPLSKDDRLCDECKQFISIDGT